MVVVVVVVVVVNRRNESLNNDALKTIMLQRMHGTISAFATQEFISF